MKGLMEYSAELLQATGGKIFLGDGGWEIAVSLKPFTIDGEKVDKILSFASESEAKSWMTSRESRISILQTRGTVMWRARSIFGAPTIRSISSR